MIVDSARWVRCVLIDMYTRLEYARFTWLGSVRMERNVKKAHTRDFRPTSKSQLSGVLRQRSKRKFLKKYRNQALRQSLQSDWRGKTEVGKSLCGEASGNLEGNSEEDSRGEVRYSVVLST
jgi:hypothetical protein